MWFENSLYPAKIIVLNDTQHTWRALCMYYWYTFCPRKCNIWTQVENISIALQGFARTQFPTNINYDPEVITFGLLAGVSLTEVQWKGLFLGEPPSWSRYPLVQVSMTVLLALFSLLNWEKWLFRALENFPTYANNQVHAVRKGWPGSKTSSYFM